MVAMGPRVEGRADDEADQTDTQPRSRDQRRWHKATAEKLHYWRVKEM